MAAIGLCGCSSGAAARSAIRTAIPTPTPGSPGQGPTVTPTVAGPGLPAPTFWNAGPGEVTPAAKTSASRALQLAGTWSGGSGRSGATARLTAKGYSAGLADALTELLGDAEAAVTDVIDAQYGGILTSTASVLTVVRQQLLHADGSRSEYGTTFDVRLVGGDSTWRITEIHPAVPGPAATQISPAAHAALANPRLHLPAAAQADIEAGTVHDSVLTALATLSKRHTLEISVLRSGHPLLVFGTTRPSDHPHGRAADVWAIDGHPVVDPANRALVVDFMREAHATGPWQVGGPVDLDGAGSAYFTNPTHQDHVHLGFLS
jgi:hypothetical protein